MPKASTQYTPDVVCPLLSRLPQSAAAVEDLSPSASTFPLVESEISCNFPFSLKIPVDPDEGVVNLK